MAVLPGSIGVTATLAVGQPVPSRLFATQPTPLTHENGEPELAVLAIQNSKLPYSAGPRTPGRGNCTGKSSSSAIENTFGRSADIGGSGSKPSGVASSISTS